MWPPFPSTYEPARIVRMRAGSLLPEYTYRFAAAAAPVVQTAGPGMPPAALSFPSCRKRLPDIQKASPGRSGGDGCAQNHVLVREKRNSSQRVMRTCTAAQTTKIRLRFGMGMGIDR